MPWVYTLSQMRISHDTRAYDGYFIDAKGRAQHPASVPAELDAVGPSEKPLAFFVNGISSDLGRTRSDMDKLKSLGCRVVGVHNATAGVLRDLGQCVADKLNIGQNGAVVTVKNLLKTARATGQSLTLIGHSQGALICSRALWETQKEMEKQGLSKAEMAQELSLVTLHTAGGAAYRFPDGPEYHHRVNLLDPVALLTGLASGIWGTTPGENSTTETFCRFVTPSESKAKETPFEGIQPKLLDQTVHGVAVYFDDSQG